MGITVAAIRRPIMICMFIMALIVFGVRGLRDMSKELIPNVDIPYVIVFVTYSGAGPEEIEVQVNRVIEQNVAGIENLKNLTSMAQDSTGIVVLACYLLSQFPRLSRCMEEWDDPAMRLNCTVPYFLATALIAW